MAKAKKTTTTSAAQKIDRYYRLKELRARIAVQDKEYRTEQLALEVEVIAQLNKDKATGARGRVASATLAPKLVPTLEDYPALTAWIRKGRGPERFSIFQRRMGSEYANSVWEAGKVIGGVTAFELDKLSVRKL